MVSVHRVTKCDGKAVLEARIPSAAGSILILTKTQGLTLTGIAVMHRSRPVTMKNGLFQESTGLYHITGKVLIS